MGMDQGRVDLLVQAKIVVRRDERNKAQPLRRYAVPREDCPHAIEMAAVVGMEQQPRFVDRVEQARPRLQCRVAGLAKVVQTTKGDVSGRIAGRSLTGGMFSSGS